jgi:hypothetical protein
MFFESPYQPTPGNPGHVVVARSAADFADDVKAYLAEVGLPVELCDTVIRLGDSLGLTVRAAADHLRALLKSEGAM